MAKNLLEAPGQGHAPTRRVVRMLKNAPDRRMSICFMTLRDGEA